MSCYYVTGDDEEVVATEDEVVVLGGDVLDVVGVVVLVVLDLSCARYAPRSRDNQNDNNYNNDNRSVQFPSFSQIRIASKTKPKACSIKS